MTFSRLKSNCAFSPERAISTVFVVLCVFCQIGTITALSQSSLRSGPTVRYYNFYRSSSSTSVTQQQGYNWITLAGQAGRPGSDDGVDNNARFNSPLGVAAGVSDKCFVGDGNNKTVRRLAVDGTNCLTSTLAGSVGAGGSVDGTNRSPRFSQIGGIAVDSAGRIYVSDTLSNTIRKITLIGTNWVVTTIAGKAGTRGSANGTNSAARFNNPAGLAVNGEGRIFVADALNHTIRKITLSGTNWVVSTVAGAAGTNGYADGWGKAGRFYRPWGIAAGSDGNLYVADSLNHTIRKLTPSENEWSVSTIVGKVRLAGSADGTNSTARFKDPRGIAMDHAGKLFVADSDNHTIRTIALIGTNWVVSTVGGWPGMSGSADGMGSDARFNTPYGIATDGQDRIYVADTLNHTIRLGWLDTTFDWTVTQRRWSTGHGVSINSRGSRWPPGMQLPNR